MSMLNNKIAPRRNCLSNKLLNIFVRKVESQGIYINNDRGSPLSLMSVCVVSADISKQRWLKRVLEKNGVKSLCFLRDGDLSALNQNLIAKISHVLIDIDTYECIAQAVDALLAFRKIAPDVVVIAIASTVQSDDFGTERRLICDATLRYPLPEHRLTDGLLIGTANLKFCPRPLR